MPIAALRLARRALLVTALYSCSLWSALSAERGASFRAALESIHEQELQSHVATLADAKYAGREAGTQGGYAAAEYLHQRLSTFGLKGAAAGGEYFQPFAPNFRNVLAILEGSDPKRKQQCILVGAHYDHVGFGMARGSTRGQPGSLHPGADDNASGTSAVLELAEAFTILPEPPRRSIVFALWDAEEKGLLGSKHFVANPSIPLSRIVQYVNLDMIGRLRSDRVVVIGARSGYGWRRLLSNCNEESSLALEFSWKVGPNADYHPFFAQAIPVVMLHTDVHDDYHRPSDTADHIESVGMRRLVRMLFGALYELASRDEAPKFREAARSENDSVRQSLEQPAPPQPERFGVRWDGQPTPGPGVRLNHVTSDSAAEKAGLRAGDRILKFAGREIHTDDDLRAAVLSAQAREKIVVQRPGNEKLEVSVELKGTPMRLGITWRADDSEPGTVFLTYVAPGSPAARAGLELGDRIYQAGGRDFSSELELVERLKNLPSPIRLQVERKGRIRTVEVVVEPAAIRQAA